MVTFEGIDTQVTRVFKNRETKSETHAFVPATFLDIFLTLPMKDALWLTPTAPLASKVLKA